MRLDPIVAAACFHVFFEGFQHDFMLAHKRSFTVVGFVTLAAHVAMPAIGMAVVGVDPWLCLATALAHFVADGPLAAAFLRFASRFGVDNVLTALSTPQHDRWPIPVQMLHFSLAVQAEERFWTALHVIAVVVGIYCADDLKEVVSFVVP